MQAKWQSKSLRRRLTLVKFQHREEKNIKAVLENRSAKVIFIFRILLASMVLGLLPQQNRLVMILIKSIKTHMSITSTCLVILHISVHVPSSGVNK